MNKKELELLMFIEDQRRFTKELRRVENRLFIENVVFSVLLFILAIVLVVGVYLSFLLV